MEFAGTMKVESVSLPGKAMQSRLTEITYDVQLQPGEALSLPQDAAKILGPGHWLVSIRPADGAERSGPLRDHSAFLNSYAPEDEGLYDDYSAG
jgi:hypothetical protein